MRGFIAYFVKFANCYIKVPDSNMFVKPMAF